MFETTLNVVGNGSESTVIKKLDALCQDKGFLKWLVFVKAW